MGGNCNVNVNDALLNMPVILKDVPFFLKRSTQLIIIPTSREEHQGSSGKGHFRLCAFHSAQ
jgi:hypothetical protein